MKVTKELKSTAMYRRWKNEKMILACKTGTNVIPEYGMGATKSVGPDRYPYTIVEIADDLSYIMVKADHYFPEMNQEDCTYSFNPESESVKYTLHKNGRYMEESARICDCELGIAIGHRLFHIGFES